MASSHEAFKLTQFIESIAARIESLSYWREWRWGRSARGARTQGV